MRSVSPARAGMDPSAVGPFDLRMSFPRTRGDGPPVSLIDLTNVPFPPHARGWTAFQNFPATDSIVSPARAGMDPI